MDMPDDTRQLLHAALAQIVLRIEVCPASLEASHAVSFASDVMLAIDTSFPERAAYALGRVREHLKLDGAGARCLMEDYDEAQLPPEQRALGDYIVDRLYADAREGRGPLAEILKLLGPVKVDI